MSASVGVASTGSALMRMSATGLGQGVLPQSLDRVADPGPSVGDDEVAQVGDDEVRDWSSHDRDRCAAALRAVAGACAGHRAGVGARISRGGGGEAVGASCGAWDQPSRAGPLIARVVLHRRS